MLVAQDLARVMAVPRGGWLPGWLPGISLAALTLGISAAHASPMHDPSQQLSAGPAGQGLLALGNG